MTELNKKKCVPCEGGVPKLNVEEINVLLKKVNKWQATEKEIFKTFMFKDFKEALEFINKIGSIAEDEGHHPDINLYSYKNVKITLSTHAINGLSENDFIIAAKIDET